MSQPWINNIPEVDWHGSNGNQIIGPEAASSRYTEARLAKATEEGMFSGIKKNNVPMILNFSEDKEWPEVLPAILPRLMLNGSQGIGVTVANHWTLFNLNELVEVINHYIETNELNYSNLYPDFPTGGILINKDDIHTIHETGKGKVILRAKTEIKDNTIYITELPYQVYVEPLIDKIKTLIEEEQIKGIEDIYNKSGKEKLLIEIVCASAPIAILTQLFSLTDLQKSYSPNQFALVGKTPTLLNLKSYLDLYIKHNQECIVREFQFDLQKSLARKEIVDGLLKALEDIDNIIALIKQSDSSNDAQKRLIVKYQFTEPQAKAIVSMRLGALAHLESIELNQEKAELIKTIENCNLIITNENKQKTIFLDRLNTLNKKYGKKRKTEVIQINFSKSKEEKEIETIPPEDCVVMMTKAGYIKRIPSSSFKVQRRNGKGIKTQNDITSTVIRTNTIDSLMVFTNKGNMYRIIVNDIPAGNNSSKGVLITNLIEMEKNEKAEIIYSIYRDTDAKFILFTTKRGIVKKTPLEDYIKTKKKTGISAIKLREGDSIASINLIKEENIAIISKNGYIIQFKSTDISSSGRTTIGIKGINISEDDEVISTLVIRNPKDYLAVFTEDGLGKRISPEERILQNRAGKGVMCIKDHKIAAATLVEDSDSLLVVGNSNSICIKASDLPIAGRVASGNAIIKNDKIKVVSKI